MFKSIIGCFNNLNLFVCHRKKKTIVKLVITQKQSNYIKLLLIFIYSSIAYYRIIIPSLEIFLKPYILVRTVLYYMVLLTKCVFQKDAKHKLAENTHH